MWFVFYGPGRRGQDDDFKGAHFPKSVILRTVFFYPRYSLSYRDLEEIMAERGVRFDQTTLNPWLVRFDPLFAAQVQAGKRQTASSRQVDETYMKGKNGPTSTGPWIATDNP